MKRGDLVRFTAATYQRWGHFGLLLDSRSGVDFKGRPWSGYFEVFVPSAGVVVIAECFMEVVVEAG